MTSLMKDPLLWILLGVLIAAVLAVMLARRTNLALRKQNADLQASQGRLEAERQRLANESATLRSEHDRDLAQVRSDAEEETKAALRTWMRSLQVLADEQQGVISDLARVKYGNDSEILADFMTIDHTNSQFGRRAQGIAALCGGWLGRRDRAAPVLDVARSAQGRIKLFDRVRIHSQVNVAVASTAVEPVAVVLAELLDNATNYSAPGTPVEINIQAVPTGVCLIVDDAGLGINAEEKDRASALLNTQGPVSITSLGSPPRVGFAVAGVLAARYGFKVSVDSVSPYGGVRAVILLPESLLTHDLPAPEAENSPTTASEGSPSSPVTAPVAIVGTTAGGLPRRRRAVAVVPPAPSPAAEPDPVPVPEHSEVTATATRLTAFARGTVRGRDTTTTEGSENQ
ncbi:ATP-binding protein [Streptomyces sp. NPDC093228]|uniref:ATP-binding protein n=1 Tax=unclassified Streptomyces TaxID=2593676 RepID=UPI000740F1D8|nr:MULTISPECIES: ATP-binding protein [unclassified Streptomyces]MDX3257814.1 sensor histidine kinase [Streptomyces sp. MI02-2A]REE60421.1 signal transduction histidine kinase [Streptomyces sp. 3212.3]